MRLRDLTPDQMTEAQRRVCEGVTAGKRGRIPAPLRAWIHSPEFGDRTQKLGEFLRYDTSLGPRRAEMAILVTARVWTARYEWFAHKREALKAGLEPAIIDAIANRRPPQFTDAHDQLVYDYAVALHRDKTIAPAMHGRAVELLGEQGVVELVGLLGYYTLVSMTLNAFEMGLPEGETSDLPD